jgi:ribA/ribD-fused uncharacterized protein
MNIIKGFSGPYRFLSNFYPAVVQLDGMYFPTVEHAYQAAKFEDVAIRRSVQVLPTPGKAKHFGGSGLIRTDWSKIRFEIMQDLVIQKFSAPEFSKMLLSTGDKYLEESNHWGDTFWGKSGGIGENKLGQILMEIRKMLRELPGA